MNKSCMWEACVFIGILGLLLAFLQWKSLKEGFREGLAPEVAAREFERSVKAHTKEGVSLCRSTICDSEQFPEIEVHVKPDGTTDRTTAGNICRRSGGASGRRYGWGKDSRATFAYPWECPKNCTIANRYGGGKTCFMPKPAKKEEKKPGEFYLAKEEAGQDDALTARDGVCPPEDEIKDVGECRTASIKFGGSEQINRNLGGHPFPYVGVGVGAGHLPGCQQQKGDKVVYFFKGAAGPAGPRAAYRVAWRRRGDGAQNMRGICKKSAPKAAPLKAAPLAPPEGYSIASPGDVEDLAAVDERGIFVPKTCQEDGKTEIATKEECMAAGKKLAASGGFKRWGGTMTTNPTFTGVYATHPKGCFTGSGFDPARLYWNTHATGCGTGTGRACTLHKEEWTARGLGGNLAVCRGGGAKKEERKPAPLKAAPPAPPPEPKANPPPAPPPVIPQGPCPKTLGRTGGYSCGGKKTLCQNNSQIGGVAECKEATEALGLDISKGSDVGMRQDIPAGCSWENGKMYWSTNSKNPGSAHANLSPVCLNQVAGGFVMKKESDENVECPVVSKEIHLKLHQAEIANKKLEKLRLKCRRSDVKTFGQAWKSGVDKDDELLFMRGKTVEGSYVPSGTIIMWAGEKPPPGWLLCNGSKNTPDLRNRFVLGVGNEKIGKKGGSSKILISQLPRHEHESLGDESRFSLGTADSMNESAGKWETVHIKSWSQGHKIYTKTQDAGLGKDYYPPYYRLAFIMKI